MATTLLVFSVLVQLVTAWMALRLIPISGGRRAWMLIALAFVTRATRHLWHLGMIVHGHDQPDLTEEIISLGVSVLTLMGVFGIAPLFDFLKNAAQEKSALLDQIEQNFSRLQVVFRSLNEGLIFADRQGTLLEWNPAARVLYEFENQKKMPATLAELVADFSFTFLDGTHVPNDLSLLHRALSGESFTNLELKVSRLNSATERIFSFSGTSIPDPKGEMSLALITLQDITEAKWAEQALKESERRFRLLAESAPIGVLESDGEGRLLYANPSWFAISGHSKTESYDTGWQQAIHPEDRGAFLEAWSHTIGSDEHSWRREFRLQRPDGQEIWANVMATVVATEDSEPATLVSTFEDISERKRIDLELRRAMEASEVANHAKREFMANMSHEIRTPMTVFIGMVEMALDGELNKNQRHYLETAKGAADTLLALVNDLLDFSRIEAGKLEFRKTPFVVAESIERVAGLFADKAHQKGLTLTFNISPTIPYDFIGDEQRICQVLTNLLVNAIKFTDQGKIEILVDRAESRFDSSIVGMIITVRDTGIGIPQEKIGFLFQRFSQVDGSATRKYGGSGLGLALSKSLVEDMGGILWVESELGKGSAFSFWLPLETSKSDVSTLASPAIQADNGTRSSLPFFERIEGRTVRILQAEDDSAIAELTQHILQKKGWSVFTVADGEKAFEAFQKGGYDLVLMDIQMPGMDGLEATRRIRGYERNKGFSVPIIALTAHAHEEDRQGCIDAGMNDFLTKPVQIDALYSCLETYLYRPEKSRS